jgi:hypothetical protein
MPSCELSELPFPRGTTYGVLTATSDYQDQNLEGREYTVPDNNPTTGIPRSNRFVTLRVVRAATGSNNTVLPGYLVVPDSTNASGKNNNNNVMAESQFSALAGTGAARAFPVDEYLPSTGVLIGDLYYIVIKGPAGVYTAAPPSNNLVFGNLCQSISGGTVDLQASFNAQSCIGRSLTGCNTTDTGPDLVTVDIGAGVMG